MNKAQEMKELATKAKDILNKEKIERTKTFYEEELLDLVREQSEDGKFSLSYYTTEDLDPAFLVRLIEQNGFDCDVYQTVCNELRIVMNWSDPKVENQKKKKFKWSFSF